MYTRSVPNRRMARELWLVDSVPVSQVSRLCGLTNSRTGTSLPGYRELIRNGSDATTDYDLDLYSNVSLEPGHASMTISYSGYPQGSETRAYKGVLNLPPGDPWALEHLSTNLPELDAKALTRLHAGLRAQRSHTNAMVSLGELGEAVRMIRKPAEALRSGALKLSRLLTKRRKQIGHGRAVADEWFNIVAGSILEVNFGWAATLADVRQTSEALARYHYGFPVRDRHVGSAKLEIAQVTSNLEQVSKTYPGSSMLTHVHRTTNTIGRVQYIAGTQLSQTASSSFERLRNVLGFTPENLLPTLYNLTPWSWLVDYFSNLGDLVSCFSTDTSDVLWVNRTTTQRSTFKCHSGATTFANQQLYIDPTILRAYSGDFGRWSVDRTTMSRRRLSGVPVPPILFSLPGSSGNQWWNIAAVLKGFFDFRPRL